MHESSGLASDASFIAHGPLPINVDVAVFQPGDDFQVLQTVICLVPVDMVYVLMGRQWSSYGLLYNPPVLHDATVLARHRDNDISSWSSRTPALPVGVPVSNPAFSETGSGAELIWIIGIPNWKHGFAELARCFPYDLPGHSCNPWQSQHEYFTGFTMVNALTNTSRDAA